MPSKIDALLESLLQIREDMGGFRSDIKTLFQRASEDRIEREREHKENQEAFAELRQSTASAIAELRQTVATLPNGQPVAVVPVNISRKGLAAAASFGLTMIAFLCWLIELAGQWLAHTIAQHWK